MAKTGQFDQKIFADIKMSPAAASTQDSNTLEAAKKRQRIHVAPFRNFIGTDIDEWMRHFRWAMLACQPDRLSVSVFLLIHWYLTDSHQTNRSGGKVWDIGSPILQRFIFCVSSTWIDSWGSRSSQTSRFLQVCRSWGVHKVINATFCHHIAVNTRLHDNHFNSLQMLGRSRSRLAHRSSIRDGRSSASCDGAGYSLFLQTPSQDDTQNWLDYSILAQIWSLWHRLNCAARPFAAFCRSLMEIRPTWRNFWKLMLDIAFYRCWQQPLGWQCSVSSHRVLQSSKYFLPSILPI